MALLSEVQRATLAGWRSVDRVVVFTNGVFDLLHAGHLSQLRAAREFGDVLVVGLNSDHSVRLLAKGTDRPIVDEVSRAELLAELRCVDMVVLFDDPTPLELIREVRPDVLVKGEDYREKEVVGQDDVEGWGGRVEFAPLLPGLSTTEIIRRIRGGAD
jgi:rfaE bifunctional protein nucleotidyltransferase chain/domain